MFAVLQISTLKQIAVGRTYKQFMRWKISKGNLAKAGTYGLIIALNLNYDQKECIIDKCQ